MTLDPNFWNDPEKAELTMKEIKDHKKWLDTYQSIQSAVDDAEILFEFQKEGEGTEAEVETKHQEALVLLDDIEFRTTLDQPEDIMDCT
ncbi:MAG: PCRF domain-containing protein, partial [Saprospiraceae bacterium]